jgi:hypothetical protein
MVKYGLFSLLTNLIQARDFTLQLIIDAVSRKMSTVAIDGLQNADGYPGYFTSVVTTD